MNMYIPFGWFYLINLLTGSIFLLVYGFRKNYPAATWLPAVALLMTLFIAGLKIAGFPLQEWPELIGATAGQPDLSKFVPGGLLFFTIGWMFIKWLLKFRSSMTDSLIMILPWMVIIQRIGCFINGCCYGTPSNLPWAVTYPAGTSAYAHYLATGDIHPGEIVSCGLHPAQLYTAAGALVIWLILMKTRRTWKSPGSRALFGLLLLGIMRFTVEFFRESAGKWYSADFAGISYLQWIILFLATGGVIVLLIRENRTDGNLSPGCLKENILKSTGILFLAILILWNLRRLFEFQELILLYALVTGALAFTVYSVYRALSVSGLKMGLTLILLIAFTTMSQDLLQTGSDTLKKSQVNTWFSITPGISDGRYENRLRDCSGNIYDRELVNLSAGGLDFSYHFQPNARNQLDFGARGWITRYNNLSNPLDDGFISYGLNPYVNYINPIIGFGLGLNAYRDFWEPSVAVLPSLYLRLGKDDVFFVDTGILDQVHLSGFLAAYHLGLGSGFRTGGKQVLRTGIAFNLSEDSEFEDVANFYLMGDFRINNKLWIKPGIYLGNKVYGMLGLTCNFGYREKSSPEFTSGK